MNAASKILEILTDMLNKTSEVHGSTVISVIIKTKISITQIRIKELTL